MTTSFHPADSARIDRIARAYRRAGNPRKLSTRGEFGPSTCDHGLAIGECRTCLELSHAEQNSITVRTAYAFSDWPPFRSFALGGLSRRLAAGHPRQAS